MVLNAWLERFGKYMYVGEYSSLFFLGIWSRIEESVLST